MTLNLSTYLVTDTALSGARGVLGVIREAVSAGVPIIQIRDKTASARDLYQLVVQAAEVTGPNVSLLVDDRVDVYLAARAIGTNVDGIHIGQSDLPVELARELIGPDAILGLTANTPEQFAAVAALPAGTVDYLGVGVIRPTSTKPDHPTPLGIDGFQSLAASTPLPCVAIGGVALSDTAALRAAGAAGLAIVSAICAAVDPFVAATEFRAAWAASAPGTFALVEGEASA
jgi:thiamine-phosphate pyrophosphorylase